MYKVYMAVVIGKTIMTGTCVRKILYLFYLAFNGAL